MKPTEFWKNFELGEELSVSGAFIYNGPRRFHELHKLDHTDEIFEVALRAVCAAAATNVVITQSMVGSGKGLHERWGIELEPFLLLARFDE
jgi:hypothetical protein